MKPNWMLLAACLALSACDPPHAAAQNAAQQRQTLTSASTIGALLADARTRPVMDRFMPNLPQNPHLDRIRDWPLRRLATDPHARGLTMERLAEIEAALAAAQR